MEKLKIAICDDVERFREMITKLIRESEQYADAEIQEYEDGEDIVNGYEAGKFDVIFMDYYMERMKGDEATKIIHSIDKRVSIIIASTESAIAVNGFWILDHVPKPFGQDVFQRLMRKHQRKMDEYKEKYIEVVSDGKKHIIISKNIEYIDKKNAMLYMEDGNIKLPEPLPDFGLEKTFQLSNGNIINLEYISQIQWGKVTLRRISMDIPISFQDWFRLKRDYKKYS